MNARRTGWPVFFGAATLILASVLALAACSDGDSDSEKSVAPEQTAAPAQSEAALAAQDDMRKLWEDHITWTRLVIVSIAGDLPDTQQTLDRLLKNQEDIGDAVASFYGDEAGAQLTALLKDHITIAGEILTAAKVGDTAAVDEANGRWYDNAAEIATLLSQANAESWPLAEMQAMMTEHLDLTLAEAVAQVQGDYATSIAKYDEVHEQILHMADMLTAGIVAQFPERFQ